MTSGTATVSARGAEVSITAEGVSVTRSLLASSLLPDATIAASELRGWYFQAPDGLSPGWIELLSAQQRALIHFSPGQTAEFAAINGRLTNLQAGYPLDDLSAAGVSAPATSAGATAGSAADSASDSAGAVTAAEWAADAHSSAPDASAGAVASEKKDGKAQRQRAPWAKVATPDEIPEANEQADIDGPVYGQNVTVTGDVEPYDKGEVWDMIAQAGGTVGKNVTKKTTMLIVGEWATMTSKEKRARELQDKGQEIKILSFDEFLELVGKK